LVELAPPPPPPPPPHRGVRRRISKVRRFSRVRWVCKASVSEKVLSSEGFCPLNECRTRLIINGDEKLVVGLLPSRVVALGVATRGDHSSDEMVGRVSRELEGKS
jgi:hypothetical protein